MIRLGEVRTRIEEQVPDLAGRLGNAGQFSQLIERNQVPQVTPAGFVLLGGLTGGQGEVMTGLFRQFFQERILVVLAVRVAGDVLGEAGIDEATPLVRAVINAVCGWAPGDALGVFDLGSAELVGSKDGALLFQIDFTLNDQLRIAT